MIDMKKTIINACKQWQKHHKGEPLLLEFSAVEELLELLKEQENEKKRNPVIICPHCGKRVK